MFVLPDSGTARLWELLREVPEEARFAALFLNAVMERVRKWECADYHRWLSEGLDSGLAVGKALRDWVREKAASEEIASPSRTSTWTRIFDDAELRANEWTSAGVRMARWADDAPLLPGDCSPRVLFLMGDMPLHLPWVAIFNSRKPRIASPDVRWLKVLRGVLACLSSRPENREIGFASSRGTMTYDLVNAHARFSHAPLLEILPSPVEEMIASAQGDSIEALNAHSLFLACRAKAAACSRRQAMVCRDRLLARVADLHVIIELRRGGNLLNTLEEEHRLRPRAKWIFLSSGERSEADGNSRLMEAFPESSTSFSEADLPAIHPPGKTRPPSSVKAGRPETSRQPSQKSSEGGSPEWSAFLYHYTRACPGPWPGENRDDYMRSLLEDNPRSGHTALDALIRITTEGKIRASARVIRGSIPVVSWTSRSPLELGAIRRWNRALIRWTFEPYGIAVRRSRLLRCGAKPVIYAREKSFGKIKLSDRYRLHPEGPSRRSWKAEKEWRLAGDFDLRGLAPGDGFLFAPTSEDAERLEREVRGHEDCMLPVLALSRLLPDA
jgi:hypothetical protein